MPPKASGAASANTSKKRKITDAGEGASTAKKARTTAAAKAKAAPASKKAAPAKAKATAAKKTAAATKKTAAAPKKTATKVTKKTPAKKTAEPKVNGATKRKTKSEEPADEEDEDEEDKKKVPAAKKAKAEKKPAEPKVKPRKKGPVINERATDILNVFVFGENSSGELGLGAEGNVIDVKRPRLNPLLKDMKIVSVAAGGMHQVFLTDDGKILTCGVNDQGSLGRETAGAEKLKDMDDDAASDADSDTGLNPLEATPAEVDLKDVPEGTVFTSVAAGDSITLAVTDEGLVFGCGTFRSNDGILGFTKTIPVQRTLIQIPGLKHIKSVACGANHVLALDKKGNAWAWGSGQQNQLGRRIVERTRFNGLTPSEFGLPKGKVSGVFCGAYHSFATDITGRVWTWGLNSYGETGIADEAGEDDAVVHTPTIVDQLGNRGVIHLAGGAHHSLAITDKGECLVFGRVDGFQSGIKLSDLPSDDVVRDEHDKVRILKTATALPNVGHAVYGACGTDQSFVINQDGRAYAWGFSVNYQTGLGVTEDVEEATLIDNTATRDEKLNWVDAGGQYGVLTSMQKAE